MTLFVFMDTKISFARKTQMSAVPLDVALERRTKRCSPRFLPGYRFWIKASDTCRQAVRERKVGP